MSLPKPKLKLTNPWAAEAPPKSVGVTQEAPPEPRTVFEDNADGTPPPVAHVQLGTYGGVTVVGAHSATEAMVHVLDFLVEHLRQVDATLVEYAVLLTRLPELPAQGFYVRRGYDGWTLAVPDAQSRDQALLQIVQALIEISRGPLKKELSAAGITPYRN